MSKIVAADPPEPTGEEAGLLSLPEPVRQLVVQLGTLLGHLNNRTTPYSAGLRLWMNQGEIDADDATRILRKMLSPPVFSTFARPHDPMRYLSAEVALVARERVCRRATVAVLEQSAQWMQDVGPPDSPRNSAPATLG